MEQPSSLRIVFMGTPAFAVASLDALIIAGFNIVGVVTSPDKPAGRGMHLQQSAVKEYAQEKHLPLLQPINLKDPAFLAALNTWHADLQIVVAFRMLPEVVWNNPSLGTINLHGSLLPQYRGAAPINWAIINGEKETGVTTFLLQQEIDTGQILLQEAIPIEPEETAGDLHDRMKMIGAQLLVKTVRGYMAQSIVPVSQDDLLKKEPKLIHQAPKIRKETGRIDWSRNADEIHNLIRGLSPVPGAHTTLEGKMLKIFKAHPLSKTLLKNPGSIDTDGHSFLHFQCGNGVIAVEELQLEGKKRMRTTEFLKGYRFSIGE